MSEHEYLAVSAAEAAHIRCKEPSSRSIRDLSDLFSVFADTTRIRIMYALYANELCVGDIAAILNLSQSAISPSAADPERCPARRQPTRRKDRVLRAG